MTSQKEENVQASQRLVCSSEAQTERLQRFLTGRRAEKTKTQNTETRGKYEIWELQGGQEDSGQTGDGSREGDQETEQTNPGPEIQEAVRDRQAVVKSKGQIQWWG